MHYHVVSSSCHIFIIHNVCIEGTSIGENSTDHL